MEGPNVLCVGMRDIPIAVIFEKCYGDLQVLRELIECLSNLQEYFDYFYFLFFIVFSFLFLFFPGCQPQEPRPMFMRGMEPGPELENVPEWFASMGAKVQK